MTLFLCTACTTDASCDLSAPSCSSAGVCQACSHNLISTASTTFPPAPGWDWIQQRKVAFLIFCHPFHVFSQPTSLTPVYRCPDKVKCIFDNLVSYAKLNWYYAPGLGAANWSVDNVNFNLALNSLTSEEGECMLYYFRSEIAIV